jgi:hypothetical protein
MKKKTSTISNAFLLNICDEKDVIIRVIELNPHDVKLMKELITDIYENQSGGITIRLKLKTNYAL